MILEWRDCDILKSPCQALVNPVNCVGVMGAGLALEFRRKWPRMYSAYQRACREGKTQVGRVRLYRDEYATDILLFPTKEDWRNPSKLEYIRDGLEHLASCAEYWQLRSIAMPKIGCGLGGLDFRDVRPLIYENMEHLSTTTVIYT